MKLIRPALLTTQTLWLTSGHLLVCIYIYSYHACTVLLSGVVSSLTSDGFFLVIS